MDSCILRLFLILFLSFASPAKFFLVENQPEVDETEKRENEPEDAIGESLMLKRPFSIKAGLLIWMSRLPLDQTTVFKATLNKLGLEQSSIENLFFRP